MMDTEDTLSDSEYTLDIFEEDAVEEEEEEEVVPVNEVIQVTNKHNDHRKSKDPTIRTTEDEENTTNSANSLDIDLNDRAHLITETFVAEDFDDVSEFDEKLTENVDNGLDCINKKNDSVKKNRTDESELVKDNFECSEKSSVKDSEKNCVNNFSSISACCNGTDSVDFSEECVKNGQQKNSHNNILGKSHLPSSILDRISNRVGCQSNTLTSSDINNHKVAILNGILTNSYASRVAIKKKAVDDTTAEINSMENVAVTKGNEVCDKKILSQTTEDTDSSRTDTHLSSSFPVKNDDMHIGGKKRKLEVLSNQNDSYLDSSLPNRSTEKYQKIDDDAKVVAPSNADAVAFKHNTVIKKNIARKHTSSMNTSKVLKDLESAVRSELQKYDENSVPNGDLQSDFNGISSDTRGSTKEERQESVVDTSKVYKVTLPLDKLEDDSLKNIFKTMRKKLTRRQLEEIVLQKVCETIADSGEIGELKKKMKELEQLETHRKQTCFSLEKQMHQLRGVCQVFMEKVKNLKDGNCLVTPTVITRSVGLQVAVDSSPYAHNNFDGQLIKCNLIPSQVSNCSSPHARLSPCSSPTPLTKTVDTKSYPSGVSNEVSKSLLLRSTSSSTSISSDTETPLSPEVPLSDEPPSKSTTPVDVESSDTAIIDLTDKDDKPEDPLINATHNAVLSDSSKSTAPNSANPSLNGGTKINITRLVIRHPAPLPPTPAHVFRTGLLLPPPRPELRIFRNKDGISLSWNLPLNQNHAKISRYQIYAYQETSALTGDPWKPVGDVNALPLPMECTLTQFISGFRYHFTVRAIDEHRRIGPFSLACSIAL